MTNHTIDPETKQLYDYYKFLQIDQAEQDTNKIRKSYLKLAQKYHPDKNDDKDYAHQMFKYLSEAYTTITDSQERAYYDRNRAKILSINQLDDSFADKETHLDLNFFRSQRCYNQVDDSKTGFYTVYDQFFKQLNKEENEAAAYQLQTEKINDKETERLEFKSTQQMPTFDSSTALKQEVYKFYDYFLNIETVKLFQFADQYSGEKENSKIRNLVNKENERFRQLARKQFNEKITEIVLYVKRRDARLEQFIIQEKEEKQQQEIMKQQQKQQQLQEEYDKIKQLNIQRKLRIQELSDKMQSNKISPQEMLELEQLTINTNFNVDKVGKQWEQQHKNEMEQKEQKKEEKSKQMQVSDFTTDKELIKKGLSVDVNNKLFCKYCNQRFQVVGEFKPHLQSKRHKSGQQQVKEEVDELKQEEQNEILKRQEKRQQDRADKYAQNANSQREKSQKLSEKIESNVEQEEINFKSQNKRKNNKYKDSDEEEESKQKDEEEKPKDKKKQKKVQEQDGQTNSFNCSICGQKYESRTKLFNHIRESGHAALKNK